MYFPSSRVPIWPFKPGLTAFNAAIRSSSVRIFGGSGLAGSSASDGESAVVSPDASDSADCDCSAFGLSEPDSEADRPQPREKAVQTTKRLKSAVRFKGKLACGWRDVSKMLVASYPLSLTGRRPPVNHPHADRPGSVTTRVSCFVAFPRVEGTPTFFLFGRIGKMTTTIAVAEAGRRSGWRFLRSRPSAALPGPSFPRPSRGTSRSGLSVRRGRLSD